MQDSMLIYKHHLKKVREHISGKSLFKDRFSINEICNVENSDVYTFSKLERSLKKFKGALSGASYAAFIPAAGASSRYFKDLNSKDSAKQSLALHQSIRDALAKGQASSSPEFHLPKALQLANESGESFLDLKQREHKEWKRIAEEIYVVAPSFKDSFSKKLKKSGPEIYLYVQDEKLSTLRVKKSGEIYLEDGEPSLVPAGHGSLKDLFPRIRKETSRDRFLIRNVDNVANLNKQTANEVDDFLSIHSFLLDQVKSIRKFIKDFEIEKARKLSADLLDFFCIKTVPDLGDLKTLLNKLFAVNKKLLEFSEEASLLPFFERPVQLFGVVKNTGNDVGGNPCWVSNKELSDALTQNERVSLEAPHMSEEDKKKFSVTKGSSYFNPVFVASEFQRKPFMPENHPYWIVAEKSYKGEKVYYYESILYEMLSSSRYNNCVFFEISKDLFNPHKSVFDTIK